MFLWWYVPLLILQLGFTKCTNVILFQVTSTTVTINVTTNNNTLPTALPTDVTLVFSPSLALSDENVFMPAKRNTSLAMPGTLEISLPLNLEMSKGTFYLFDRVIPHKMDEQMIQLAVDSFAFSLQPVSSIDKSLKQITELEYALDEEVVMRRCAPLKAFAPFHQESRRRVCEAFVVINEVSLGDRECVDSTFVTLYDGGVGHTNLTGYTLLVYEGDLLVQSVDLTTATGDQGLVRFGGAGEVGFHYNTSKITLKDAAGKILDIFLVGVNNTQYNLTGVPPLLLSNRSYARCLCSTPLNMGCFTQAVPADTLHHMCQPRTLLITEVWFNTEEGFIELYDGGRGNTLLTGYEVVIFDDQSSRSLASFSLSGYSTSSSGFFVISAVESADMVVSQSQLRPHTVAIALYLSRTRVPVFSSTGQEATTDNLVDVVVFEGLKGVSKVAQILMPSRTTLIYQVGSQSHSRCDSLTPFDTDAYILTTPSPGASNQCILRERHWRRHGVFINEVFGAETCQRNHYIELASHQPNTALHNMSLVLYEASTATRYFSVALGDFTTSTAGLLILSREVISDGLLPTHGAYVISLYKETKDTQLPTTRGLVDSILYHFLPTLDHFPALDYKFPHSHLVMGHGQSDGHTPVSNNYCPKCGAGTPCFQTAGKTPNKLNLCKEEENTVLFTKPYRVKVGVRPRLRFYTISMKVMLSNATCSWWRGSSLMADEMGRELSESIRLSIRGHCKMFSIKAVETVSRACLKGDYGFVTQLNVTIATIYATGDLHRDQACLTTWSDALSVLTFDGVVFRAHVVCINDCQMGIQSNTHANVQIISVSVVVSVLLLIILVTLTVKWKVITKYIQHRQVPDDMIELHNPSLCEDYELEHDDLDYHSPEDGFI